MAVVDSTPDRHYFSDLTRDGCDVLYMLICLNLAVNFGRLSSAAAADSLVFLTRIQ